MRSPSTGITPPHARMSPLPDGDVRWTEGFWAEKFAMAKDNTLPSMLEALRDPQNGAYLGNFTAQANGEHDHHATFWSDGDCYKYIQALAHAYSITGEAGLLALMDDLIVEIASAQQPDGYINTQITLPGLERWADQRKHEHYNLGHLFTAAAQHFRITGQTNFLDIAVKAGDCVYGTFASRPPELRNFEFNPANIMGLVDLYEVTGDRRFLELANTFTDLRGSNPEGGIGDCNQDRMPLREETRAYGHAVTATYLYAGAADVYMHTGDRSLLSALEAIWQDVTQRKMYVTGGAGALHSGVSERGGQRHDAQDKVWEAFGATFQLPNASAYNESCANIGLAMWAHRMASITGEAKYADVMEVVLYNAGLSPVSLSGTTFTYTNPLRWHGPDHNRFVSLSHDSQQRWDRWECYCCPPQVARTLTGLQRWAVSGDGDALWVHLFGGARVRTELKAGSFAFDMRTDYPWDGDVAIAIVDAPTDPVALNVRIPGWATTATLAVNGETLEAQPGSYVTIERAWRAGDRIELGLPLESRLVAGHPRIEEVRNHVAVRRGPVVYCLESIDLPPGIDIDGVMVPAGATYSPDDEAINGVRLLSGDGLYVARDAGDGLYSELGAAAPRRIDLRLVPYYAWNNRGVTKMSVWLPLAIGATAG